MMLEDSDLFGKPVELSAAHAAVVGNKFHAGNGSDAKHYWLTPPDLYQSLTVRFNFDFDPCPFPKPDDFDGLTGEWGQSSYVNPPFGSIIHEGKKKGPTAWARKAIIEHAKGKRVVMVYPIDKWVLMLLAAGAKVENLGDVRWVATEDGSTGKGTGRHIACFILEPKAADEEGNSRLIAAAPELLACLQDFVEGFDPNKEYEGGYLAFTSKANNALAAIAKATGK